MGKIYLQEKITPVKDKYIVADRNGYLTAGDIVTEVKPQLVITGMNVNLASADSVSLYCNSQPKTLEMHYVDDSTIICYPNEFGEWKVKVEINHPDSDNDIFEDSVVVDSIGIFYISLFSEAVSEGGINNDDWGTIKDVTDDGTASSYYSIGDVKEIQLKGGTFGRLLIPEGYKLYAFVIGIDHNAGVEGSGITFQFGYRLETSPFAVAFVDDYYNIDAETRPTYMFRMNESSDVHSGWKDCFARNSLLSTTGSYSLYPLLPDDLKSVMSTKNLYTDNSTISAVEDISPTDVSRTDDYLFLLSEYEIFGTILNSNPYEKDMQKQYAYYKTYSKRKYKHNSSNINNPEPCGYWTRSKGYSENGHPYCMVSDRSESSKLKDCIYSEGFAPAFFIGNNTPVSTNVRIIASGATTRSTSKMGSYLRINGIAYSEVGKIMISGATDIEVWAKAGVINAPNPFTGFVGCKVNGEVRGDTTKNTSSYSKIYTYQTPANFSGVISISLVSNSQVKYGTPTYYVKITDTNI